MNNHYTLALFMGEINPLSLTHTRNTHSLKLKTQNDVWICVYCNTQTLRLQFSLSGCSWTRSDLALFPSQQRAFAGLVLNCHSVRDENAISTHALIILLGPLGEAPLLGHHDLKHHQFYMWTSLFNIGFNFSKAYARAQPKRHMSEVNNHPADVKSRQWRITIYALWQHIILHSSPIAIQTRTHSNFNITVKCNSWRHHDCKLKCASKAGTLRAFM